MSSDVVRVLVQAFISCRMDYCNSLFYGISDGLMTRLQSVQNAAARVGRSTAWPHHADATATPVALASGSEAGGLRDGHLDLPRSLSGMTLAYLAADCQLVSVGRHQLRSVHYRTCVVSRGVGDGGGQGAGTIFFGQKSCKIGHFVNFSCVYFRLAVLAPLPPKLTELLRLCTTWTYSNFGDRCFAADGPKLWNRLPAGLKPISQLRFDYDTTMTRLQRKIDMFIFCSRRIASNGSRRARYVVVGS